MCSDCINCEYRLEKQKKADNACRKYADIIKSLNGVDVFAQSRLRQIVWSRNIVIKQMAEDGFSVYEIADAIGRKRSTVIHSINNMQSMLDMPWVYREEMYIYNKFKNQIKCSRDSKNGGTSTSQTL